MRRKKGPFGCKHSLFHWGVGGRPNGFFVAMKRAMPFYGIPSFWGGSSFSGWVSSSSLAKYKNPYSHPISIAEIESLAKGVATEWGPRADEGGYLHLRLHSRLA